MSETTPIPPEERSRDGKRARLARLLEARAKGPPSFQLSYPQRRLWFLAELQPDSPVYNVPLAYGIRGRLDVPALSGALRRVVSRHEVLRARFRTQNGAPRQVIVPEGAWCLPVIDLSGAPDPGRLAERLWRQEAHRPFDLARGPLFRAVLLRLRTGDHRLLLCLHHLVCDGWSIRILAEEIRDLYRAATSGSPPRLPELAVQYPEFAHWQIESLRGPELDELLGYWSGQLQGITDVAALPADRPRAPLQTYRGRFLPFRVPGGVVRKLDELSRSRGLTPFMVLVAGFCALLDRYAAGEDAVLGTPVANRNRLEWEPLVGFFANTLVLRTSLRGDPTFEDLAERVRRTVLDAFAHQDLPFERLVEELQPERDLAQNPLFQILISYRDGDGEALELPGLEVEVSAAGTETAKFDLSVSFARVGAELSGRLEYSTDLYDATSAGRMLRHLGAVLEEVLDHPDRCLSRLTGVTASERHHVLVEWNDTAIAFDPEAPVHGVFAAQAVRRELEEAVIQGGSSVTYGELARSVRGLARELRSLGVGPEVPVGLYLDRSPRLVVALLAVLEAGGAYLPLDPQYPQDRLRFMLEDSGAPVVVTTRELAGRLPRTDARVLHLDREGGAGLEPSSSAPTADPESLAYVIYTSGSTGRPKGVMVPHRALSNFLAAMDRVLLAGDRAPGTWLAVTSVSFDISVLELLWTLSRGFRVVLGSGEPAALAADAESAPAADPARPIELSLFYFASGGDDDESRYRLLVEGAKFADRAGFSAVWTPERHFHPFGGLYPNPSVASAALAMVTERVALRAGSVVLPLHEPLRVAEEWAVVDNLSGGRVGVSFASGWHANDFALAPDRYEERKEAMFRGIEEVRHLWRGGTVRRRNGKGREIELKAFPRPVQDELPIWLTSARNPETFRMAGELGAGVLTHLLGHSAEELVEKIAIYRRAWREHGHGPGDGRVAVMLHAFAGPDVESVRETVRGPLQSYLKSSFDLVARLGEAHDIDFDSLPEAELDALIERAFDRFFEGAGLLGDPAKCADMVDRLRAIGVDEVACLIDFGVPEEEVLEHLPYLGEARLESSRRQAAADSPPLAEELRRWAVSHLQCTPSFARLLAGSPPIRRSLGSLDALLLGGEALPSDLAEDLGGVVGGELLNMYGPTETTVWSSVGRVEQARGAVTLGRPVANTRIVLLDPRGRPAPLGVPGEVCIGGLGVTRGYLGRPALTAERFVPDPAAGIRGGRLYRTGDLARFRPDGELSFLGRLDHQVKVRGHRVELGEVEHALAACPGVREAVAAVRREDGTETRLVAYYVSGGNGDGPASEALRSHLRERLPEAMVPAAFVRLDELPLTPNGKVDRRALPDPDGQRPELAVSFEPPEGRLEGTIAEVWMEVLGLDRVGADDNFFELGGNSMLIVQARSRLLDRLDAGFSLVDLFRYPTVRTLARFLGGEGPGARAGLEEVEVRSSRRRDAVAEQRRRRRPQGEEAGGRRQGEAR